MQQYCPFSIADLSVQVILPVFRGAKLYKIRATSFSIINYKLILLSQEFGEPKDYFG